MKNNQRKINLYTQGQRWTARVLLIVGLLGSGLVSVLASREDGAIAATSKTSLGSFWGRLGKIAVVGTLLSVPGSSLGFEGHYGECSENQELDRLRQWLQQSRDWPDVCLKGNEHLCPDFSTSHAIRLLKEDVDQPSSLPQMFCQHQNQNLKLNLPQPNNIEDAISYGRAITIIETAASSNETCLLFDFSSQIDPNATNAYGYDTRSIVYNAYSSELMDRVDPEIDDALQSIHDFLIKCHPNLFLLTRTHNDHVPNSSKRMTGRQRRAYYHYPNDPFPISASCNKIADLMKQDRQQQQLHSLPNNPKEKDCEELLTGKDINVAQKNNSPQHVVLKGQDYKINKAIIDALKSCVEVVYKNLTLVVTGTDEEGQQFSKKIQAPQALV